MSKGMKLRDVKRALDEHGCTSNPGRGPHVKWTCRAESTRRTSRDPGTSPRELSATRSGAWSACRKGGCSDHLHSPGQALGARLGTAYRPPWRYPIAHDRVADNSRGD